MMVQNDLTDFTDMSDVSDDALEWVLRETGCPWSAATTRLDAYRAVNADRARIIAARLIQQHRPDLLVDPVDAMVREELAKALEEQGNSETASRFRNGECDHSSAFIAAKRLYLMGKGEI